MRLLRRFEISTPGLGLGLGPPDGGWAIRKAGSTRPEAPSEIEQNISTAASAPSGSAAVPRAARCARPEAARDHRARAFSVETRSPDRCGAMAAR